MLRAAASLADYLARSDDRYLAGRRFVAFCARGCAGFVAWGDAHQSDVDALVAALPLDETSAALAPLRYVDVRRLDAIDAGAVASFAAYLSSNARRLGALVDRAAVVHGGGLGLVLASGMNSLASLPYDVSFFPEPALAFAWLGIAAGPRLAAALDELQANALGTTPLVRDLRAHLTAHLRTAELATAAAALAMSPRALQRKLHAERTSFVAELAVARVEAAKALLADGGGSIADVARDVGCASVQHFGQVFRKHTGRTPRQWRAGGGATSR